MGLNGERIFLAIATFIERNKIWAKEELSKDKDFFKKLSSGQNPHVLYIGCSDSRVSAESFMCARPGEFFVHRNIANQVYATDSNINAVIQYALDHLKIKDIVICGHYGCGGIIAAMDAKNSGTLNNWLQGIQGVYRLHQDELEQIEDLQMRSDRLVELNVIEQALNISKLNYIKEKWRENIAVKIHGIVFDLRSGSIIDLKLKIKKE